MISKKKVLLLSCVLGCALLSFGLVWHQPKAIAQTRDSKGELVSAVNSPGTKETEIGLEISKLLRANEWVDAASTFCRYSDENIGMLDVTVMIDMVDNMNCSLEDKEDEVVSMVTDTVSKAGLEIGELVIFDASSNSDRDA